MSVDERDVSNPELHGPPSTESRLREKRSTEGKKELQQSSRQDSIPTHLDLFSGIGGFALAAKWAGFRTIGFCEIDKYCRRVLRKNFRAETVENSAGNGRREIGSRESSASSQKVLAKNFLADTEGGTGELQQGQRKDLRNKSAINGAPGIIGSIFDLDGRQFAGVSLITGGFPCQPFSVAGNRRGAADDRAIWPEMFRVISEARPAWVLGENVPGIITMELDNVLSDLERIGYATRTFIVPACAVDARHRRDRAWIVGRLCNTPGAGLPNGADLSVGTTGELQSESERPNRWATEPDVGRVAHGIPFELDLIGRLNENPDGQKTNTEIDLTTREVLRTMWEQRKLAETSSSLYRAYLRDFMPALSRESSQSGWLLGKRIEKNKELRDLWERFYTASYKEAQNLQRELLERIGQEKRPQALGSRVDRLKGLGNAIVPQVAYEILREIRKQITP